MIYNMSRFTVLALALLAFVPSVKAARQLRGNDRCGVGTGMEYCRAQGCVHPWDSSTTKQCCHQLHGFHWEYGQCVSKYEPATVPPTPPPVNPNNCGVGTGMEYCRAQGCVQPWDSSTTKQCCHDLRGYTWQSFVGGPGGRCVAK